MNISLTDTKNKKQSPLAQLRAALLAHIEDWQDPVLTALRGSGLSVMETVNVWAEVQSQRERIFEDAARTHTLEEAFSLAEEYLHTIAARLAAAAAGSDQ